MKTKATKLPWSPRNHNAGRTNNPDAKQKKLDEAVAIFNRQHPVGTRVRYWRGIREGAGLVGFTKSAAGILGDHTAVVWIAGCSGCIALSHVEPLDRPVEAGHLESADFTGGDVD